MVARQYILFSIATALTVMCGCTAIDKDLPVSFYGNEDLISQTNLTPSEPRTNDTQLSAGEHPESNPNFDHGPLDDFNFSNADNYARLGLADCISQALKGSPVVRDLGGLILRSPDSISTIHDPALAYTDPRFGEEAALSEFDARFNGQLIFQKNDRLYNNLFIGSEGSSQQDLAGYRAGLTKLAATGTQFQFNHVIDYDLNNSPSNRFNDRADRSFAYDTFLEGFIRPPLFQGAGTTINRIAGPNNAPGVNRGVLIARSNTDIALADFETKIRDLVSDVENAYWDLYFAYRDLEAKIEARNGAYNIWRNLAANIEEKNAAVIGQAKEQYYRFAADVEDAIHGRPVDGTRTNNGSPSGTFRRSGGVRTSERRLRLITGMTLNDSKLVVPADLPTNTSSVFDWEQAKTEALSLRPELRRQRWKRKRWELELLASKNHLLPRVDLIGKYRLKGFGHDLFGDGNELNVNGTTEQQLDSSAFGTLANGNLQEWEVGLDVSVPIGFRKPFAAMRNAELNIARENAVLKEQERQVIFGLSNAIGELNRANRVRTANQNRLDAAQEQFDAIQNIWREQDTTIDLVLEAQRRVIEGKLQYFQTQVEMMLAIKSIHFEKGTLFDYHNIELAEGPTNRAALNQAADQARRRKKSALNFSIPGLAIGRPTASKTGQLSSDSKPIHISQEQLLPLGDTSGTQPTNEAPPASYEAPSTGLNQGTIPTDNSIPTPNISNLTPPPKQQSLQSESSGYAEENFSDMGTGIQQEDSGVQQLPVPDQPNGRDARPSGQAKPIQTFEEIKPREPANDFSRQGRRGQPQVIQASGTEPIRPVYQFNLSDSSLGK